MTEGAAVGGLRYEARQNGRAVFLGRSVQVARTWIDGPRWQCGRWVASTGQSCPRAVSG